jgi:hypothetical protein
MITCRFWIDEKQNWGEEVIIDVAEEPLRMDKRHDEQLETASFETLSDYMPYELPIKPYTKCRIVDDLGEVYNYFVKSYDDVIMGPSNKTKLRHIRFELIEQLAVTQKLFPDNLCFSNDLDTNGNPIPRTIADVLLRVKNQLWTVPEMDKYDPAYAPFNFSFDTTADWAQKVAPEMFFTGQSLFEILVQIGAVIGGFPRLDFREQDGNYILTYRMWDTSTTNHVDEDLVTIKRHTDMDGMANVLVSDLENLQNMDGSNTIVEPCNDGFMPVCTEENETEITEEGAIFTTKKPISQILSMTFSLNDNPDKVVTCTKTNHPIWLEYDEWRTLPSASLINIFTGPTRGDYLYYIKGDTKIYNFFSSSYEQTPYYNVMRYLGLEELARPRRVLLRIKYIPYQAMRVKAYNNGDKPITELINQSEQVISSQYIASNMQGLVDRMSGSYNIYQKSVPRGTRLYKAGESLNGEIITAAKYEFGNMRVNCIYETAPFNRRSQYIGVNNNVRTWLIPNDNIADRSLHYSEIVEVEINPQSVEVNTGSLQATGITLLSDYMTDLNRPDLAYIAWKDTDQIRTDADEISTDYAMATLSALPFGKSVLLTWETADNVSMGNRSYHKLALDVYEYSANIQNFIQYNAKSTYMNVFFHNSKPSFYNTFRNDLLPLGEESENQSFQFTFPALSAAQYRDKKSTDPIAVFGQFKIDKDLRERIKFVYQLDFVAKNGTIVYDKAIALNRLCYNQKTELRAWKNSNKPYNPADVKKHEDAVACDINNIGSYTNLAITDTEGNLMFATNTAGQMTTLNIGFVNKKRRWKRI